MSNLESAARRVLTPLILGKSGTISEADAGEIAAWVQKTALVGMLVCTADERRNGYGLPQEEYHALHALRQQKIPLPASQFWVGRYQDEQRLSSVWVTPMTLKLGDFSEGELPIAYVMTVVLGQVLFQGVRFTEPGIQFALSAKEGLAQFWPNMGPVNWPNQSPVDDLRFVGLSKGRELAPELGDVTLVAWRPAVDLPRSTLEGSRVRVLAPCGKHSVFYPMDIAAAGIAGDYYAFIASCECGKFYLMQTEEDGVHFKGEGTREIVTATYESLAGEEFVIEDGSERFTFKEVRL